MCNRVALTCLALSLWAAEGLRADVTIRYQSEFKPAPGLQAMMEQIVKAAQKGSSSVAIRMKGNKAYTSAGTLVEIFDFVKQDVTVMDPGHKTFATFPASQLADKVAAAVPQITPEQSKAVQEASALIKTKAESKVSGRTAVIQGVQAEERDVTLSMDIPMPAPAADASQNSSPGLRLVMHIWTAKPEEALRNPAIRELTGYNAWQKYILNPAGAMEKLAGKMPGIGEAMRPLFEEVFKNQTVILRTHMQMYMPFLASVARKMGQNAPTLEPDAPLMEMTQEVAELSSAPVDAALFDIPQDYTAAPADDLIRDLIKAQSGSPTTK